MSKYGMGMLDDTIKKIQKRKVATKEAIGGVRKASAPAKGAVKVAAKGKPVRRNEMRETAKVRKITKSVQKTAAQGAASKASARARVAARIANRKKKGGLRRAAMR